MAKYLIIFSPCETSSDYVKFNELQFLFVEGKLITDIIKNLLIKEKKFRWYISNVIRTFESGKGVRLDKNSNETPDEDSKEKIRKTQGYLFIKYDDLNLDFYDSELNHNKQDVIKLENFINDNIEDVVYIVDSYYKHNILNMKIEKL